MKPAPFTDPEIEDLRSRLLAGREPSCPRCGDTLQERSIPPRSDVSYVRRRLWLVCGRCRATAVIDLPARGGASNPESREGG